MESNEPILRICSVKTLGTQLSELGQVNKLLTLAPSSHLLNARTVYLCAVGEPDLHLSLYTWPTREKLTEEILLSTTTYPPGYTVFKLTLKSKTMPLLMVWHNPNAKRVLYFALFSVKRDERFVPPEAMQQIFASFGDLPVIDLGFQLAKGVSDMDIEPSNTNAPVVGEPVVYPQLQPLAQPYPQPEPQLVIHIVATEVRKWAWRGTVLQSGNVVTFVEEHDMRGGQARHSVITRCKEYVYRNYPSAQIKVDEQPRKKDPLKEAGQKYLDGIVSKFGQTAKMVVPANVNVPDKVTITVFEIQHPKTPQDAWIALVCDDSRRIAFEMRKTDFETVVDEAKQYVRELLGDPNVEFNLEVQKKKKPKDDVRQKVHNLFANVPTESVAIGMQTIMDWILTFK